MNNLQVFEYEHKKLRTIIKDGEPWWVLKDVCKALKIQQPHFVTKRLDEDERGLTTLTDALGREQDTTIINESGLYNVILRSDKPEAKKFKRWVTHEVLPSLRKTGAYIISGTTSTSNELILKEFKDMNRTMLVLVEGIGKIADKMSDIERRVTNLENGYGQNDDESEYEVNLKVKKRYRSCLTILKFPQEIIDYIDVLLDSHVTYEEIAKKVTEKGFSISSSSIGRYYQLTRYGYYTTSNGKKFYE